MGESQSVHIPLRQEWAGTPAEVSYRFVVSPATLRRANVALQSFRRRKKSGRRRVLASFALVFLRYLIGYSTMALLGWLSFLSAEMVDRALGAAPHSEFLPIVTFLAIFSGLFVGFRVAARRLARLPLERLYQEFYDGNEFLLEGRKSHLWFDERSAGAIRRWSTFERILEFEEGMWLLLRRRTTFAGLRGLLISKESLADSCEWAELRMYASERIGSRSGD
jgi:hypothetical protein